MAERLAELLDLLSVVLGIVLVTTISSNII